MANFPPLKARFLQVLDEALSRTDVGGRFLDFGAGRGDVGLHLYRHHGLTGDFVETSDEARARLAGDVQTKDFPLFQSLDEAGRESYSLITAFDVIEHVPSPHSLLASFHDTLETDGLLAVVIPYRPSTWGWDDGFYGHLRRWSLRGAINAVESSGFEILYLCDPTFPVYSTMRKLMLTFGKPHSSVGGSALEKSEASSGHNAWGEVPAWTRALPWSLLNTLCSMFQEFPRGDELFILARKGRHRATCQVCGRAEMTWKKNIGDNALQSCRFCHSQRVITGRRTEHHVAPSLLSSELSHVRDILANHPSAKSVLEIGCGDGLMLHELKSLGWRVQGIEWRECKPREDVPVHRGRLADYETDDRFDLVVLCGELELMKDLPEMVARFRQLVVPTGMVMIEMVDMTRLIGRIRGLLATPTTVLNTRAVCDLFGNEDFAMVRKRRLSGGRIQLWFRKQS